MVPGSGGVHGRRPDATCATGEFGDVFELGILDRTLEKPRFRGAFLLAGYA
jgi:hypothetical protein